MTVYQFISSFTNVGVLDYIDVKCGYGFDRCYIATMDWRKYLRDFLDNWGEFNIISFQLINRHDSIALTLNIES